MRTFNEFVEAKSLDPILEELAVATVETMLMSDMDPWEEFTQYCNAVHPHLGLIYTEEANAYAEMMAKLDEGELDEGFWGNLWDKAKNSTIGRAIGGIGQGLAQGADYGARVAGAAATGAYRQGAQTLQSMFGVEKKFQDAFFAIQGLQKALQHPEIQQLAQAGKLTLDTPQGKMDALQFFGNLANTMQQNRDRLTQALKPQRDAARVKDMQSTVASDPRSRGTTAAQNVVPAPQTAAAPAAGTGAA